MKIFCRTTVAVLCVGLGAGCLFAVGQQGAVAFKHFKTYPTGQWSQQVQAYRNGTPLGPPQSTTICSSPLNASQAAMVTKAGNDAAPTCKIKVLLDEERTAEYEQVCATGPQQQVIHSTMRAIDDKTMSLELRNSIDGHEMSLAKITSRYEGACTAGQVSTGQGMAGQGAPANFKMPSVPKPSAEECAKVPEMRQQVDETMKGCVTEDMPESDRARCKAAMQRLTVSVQRLESACK